MPFKPTSGFFIVAIIIAVVIIGGLIAASSAPNPKSSNPTGTKVFTVQADIGIANITITNLNTGGGPITIFNENLPFSFNFTKGDTIRLQATVMTGYDFNAWYFSGGEWAGTWDSRNNPPLVIKPTKDVVVLATVNLRSDLP